MNRKKIGAMNISLELVQKWWMPKKSGSFVVGGETDDKMMDFEVTEIEMIICIYV
jgi:hypothetical protein